MNEKVKHTNTRVHFDVLLELLLNVFFKLLAAENVVRLQEMPVFPVIELK